VKAWNSISSQLKARRKTTGLSLAQVARRAGTSAATLSRYENGWTRFELYTLRKLAAALGCGLEIRLRPTKRPAAPASEEQRLHRLQRLFWDHRLKPSDIRQHTRWVMERVLENGQLEDVHALMALLGRDTFLEGVRRVNGMSPRTRAFWDAILEQEHVPCEKNAPFRREAGIFWTAWKR
jgi:transcriptional regulator with XRE-family HTH domain